MTTLVVLFLAIGWFLTAVVMGCMLSSAREAQRGARRDAEMFDKHFWSATDRARASARDADRIRAALREAIEVLTAAEAGEDDDE